MKLILHDYFRSSASYRVRIALHLKQLDYETIPVQLLQNQHQAEQYKKINPQALVPSLIAGSDILTQSLAIIEYLDEIYPQVPLLPQTPLEKAQVRAFSLMIAADCHPLNNLRVLNYLTHEGHFTEAQKMQWYHHWMQKSLQALEAEICRRPVTGPFCFGKEPTLADICLVPQLYNARRFGCDLTPYRSLMKIDAHCQEHPAFVAAFPEENKEVANATH